MKKVLSALLAMLMVVSCMAGITFSVAAEATETKTDLYSEGAGTTQQFAKSGQTSYGQRLTIPEGQVLTGVELRMSYTYGQGNSGVKFAVYQWNTDYATTVAGSPLYVEDPTTKISDNAQNQRIATIDSSIYQIQGEILWVVSRTGGNTSVIGCGQSSAELPAGVVSYSNGAVSTGSGMWGSGKGIAASIYTTEKSNEVITSMKLAGEACSTQYNWQLATTEIGQRFSVPAGNVLTGYTVGQLHDYKGSNNTGRLDIYQWASNYAISTAAEPLFSMEFAGYNGKALEAVIPADKKIGGEVIAVITYLSGDGAGWKPQGGSEAVSGVTHYADGLAYAGSTNAKGIYSWINWEEGEAVINVSEYNKVPLYTGASNTGGQFTNSALSGAAKQTVGQKFSLDGEILACISFDMLRTYDDAVAENRGVLKVYVWDTDYATTVASTPKYSVEFANHRNNNARAFAIPTELGLTGTLYWEIECLAASSNMKHGYVPGTGAAKAGVESFRNGAPIASVWSGDKNIGCDVFTLDMEETSYPLYVTAGGSQYTGNTNHTAVIGQTAVIPAGKVLSGIDFGAMRASTYAWGSTITGIFNVYQWAGSYAETVSRTPLYTDANISVKHDNALKIEIPASLMIEGSILWTLTPTTAGITFNPDGARDQIAGTTSYTDGVAKKGPWSGGEYIKSNLLLVDGGIYAAGETTSAGLYNGTANVDMAWGGNWTVRQFGQKFTVPEGKNLKSITMKLNVSGGDGKGTLNFYSWQGNLTDTLKLAPVYSEAISVPGDNTMYTVTIPAGLGLSGEVMWYLDCGSDTSPIAFGATAIGTDVLDIINGQYTNQCGGGWGLSGWNGAKALCPTVTYETAGVTYINSIDKTVIYSGNVAFNNMPSATRTAFRAEANKYANGAWGAWDGTFTHVGGGVYYTNHTFAETVSVDGVATELNDKNYVIVEANPVGFVGWMDNNGTFVSNSVVIKWFPKSADATLTAVYEGEFAPAVSATATIKNGLLTVVVTPSLNSSVSEYGYYISTTGAIDTEALDGVTKVTANNAYAAYLQRVYNLKPATTNVYVLPYIVVNGNVVYGAPVSVAA